MATIYLPIRSQISSIIQQIKSEHPELFALEFGKITEPYFVYTLASPNINQSAPKLVKMYVAIRSRMSLIMDLIRADLSELFALQLAKIAESDFSLHSSIYKSRPMSTKHGHNIYMTMRSWMSSVMSQIRQ